ncbi:hypothetical protein SEA_CUCURBITA_113 [Gordonia phage Cucurbita]|uniref:site-specific recombination directionality factor RDF n=1 Tax=Gordonia phage Cucurbita TaxID=1887645 RepID=UPI00084ED3FA|nr:site-specific recombination directionality factor RDF [Gordonia phage Cucurbita]AOE44202.1 hypothetical protein SEA_CUCURBITA_113 [Gordonia phage Cucurbita]WKW85911.1 hypothetical protein SEA_PHINKBODEN_112 [Gordonia Phage PhinkBoden]
MKPFKKFAAAAVALAAGATILTACDGQNEADVVSENIATAADNFEINRRIVIINNQAPEAERVIQLIEGWCNAEIDPDVIRTTCRVPGGYHKHINGRNAHTTFSVQQLDAARVSKDHYRVVYNPSTIIPDIEIR